MKLNLNASDLIQVVMAVVTAAGILIAIDSNRTQMKVFNQQLRLNFFADYTKRYQEIMLSFPDNINEPDFDFAKLEKDVRSQTVKSMRSYFNLCSEEYHLAKEEHIDTAVWQLWSSGISYTMTKKAYQDGWQLICRDTMFDPSFKQWMDQLPRTRPPEPAKAEHPTSSVKVVTPHHGPSELAVPWWRATG